MDSTTSETAEALTKDVKRLKDDVAQLTADVKAHGQARVEDVRQRVNDAVASAQAQLAAHPLAVLGFGLVLGFIFGRRRRRRHQA
jgi:ElaB/YqjD/DUF883 family membrane-anchored ribosome-binding protein